MVYLLPMSQTNAPPMAPIETLLANRQWVRNLARRLVFDPNRADDLEQSTWLAALRNPPRSGVPVRGWLATVMRNTARNMHREEGRRQHREARVARADRADDTAAVVANAEEAKQLIQRVLDLDEPYRETLLLRYFEDLAPREIARRMDVPVETVRTRTRRALKRMRDQMDGEHGGDRRAWCLALLPLIEPGRGGAVAAGATATATATGIVAKWVAVAATVGMAVAGGIALLDGSAAPTDVARSDQEVTVAPPAGPVATDDATPATTDPSSTSDPSGAPSGAGEVVDENRAEAKTGKTLPAGRLEGLVIDSAGRPIAGATVKVMAGELASYAGTALTAALGEDLAKGRVEVRSGDDGRFTCAEVLPGRALLFVNADGYASARSSAPVVRAGETTVVDDVVLTVEAVVSGTVRTPAGEPVEGARVRATRSGSAATKGVPEPIGMVTTDAAGRYRLDSLPAGDAQIEAQADGWRRSKAPARLQQGSELVKDITLTAGEGLSGRVVDHDGDPIEGAEVSVTWAAQGDPMADLVDPGVRTVTARSDADGGFRVRGLAAGPYVVVAQAPGFVEGRLTGVAADEEVELKLTPGARIAGVVVAGASAAPLAGAWVTLEGGPGRPGVSPMMARLNGATTAQTDDTGAFAFESLAAGEYRLTAEGTLHAQSEPLPVALAVGETREDLRIALELGASISGRVVDPEGRAAAGAVVRLHEPDPFMGMVPPEMISGKPPRSAQADAAGAFSLGGLPPGPVDLDVTLEGFARTSARLEAPGRDVTIELRRGGTIEGTVFGPGGRPKADAQVVAFRVGGTPGMETTDAEGVYRIGGLAAGTYSVAVIDPTSPNMMSGMSTVGVVDGEVARVDFGRVGTGPAIRGVVLRQGRPVAGAMVLLSGNGVVEATATDDDGRFSFEVARPGTYMVSTQAPIARAQVTVEGDEDPAEVQLQLPSSKLAGVVHDGETDEPVAGVMVVVAEAGLGAAPAPGTVAGSIVAQTQTDTAGRFSVDLPTGVFAIEFQAQQYAALHATGVATDAEGAVYTLHRGTRTAVHVEDERGQPVAGAVVVRTDAATMLALAMRTPGGADGIAHVRLAHGRWPLTVSAPGFLPKSFELDTGTDSTVRVRLRRGGRLDVRVRGADGPLAGVAVRLVGADDETIPLLPIAQEMMASQPSAVTDAEGRATRKRVPPGEVRVVATAPDGRTATATAKVVAGETTELDVEF